MHSCHLFPAQEQIQGRVYPWWSDRRQCAIKGMKIDDLFVIQVTVSGQNLTFELLLVTVPKVSGLGVQRARTVDNIVSKELSRGSWIWFFTC